MLAGDKNKHTGETPTLRAGHCVSDCG